MRGSAARSPSAPAARRRSATQSAAAASPALPGERSAKRSTNSFVAASACAPSNVGGSELRGSAGAVRAPTSSTNAGTSTTSQPARYGPGRSSAAARGARAALRRTLARRDRRSRGAPSGNIGSEYARRRRSAPPRARGATHLDCGREREPWDDPRDRRRGRRSAPRALPARARGLPRPRGDRAARTACGWSRPSGPTSCCST